MATALSALTLLAVHAATLTPSTVPATGRQEALLTLDAPATVHLSARSASGTSCEVIDRVRGPFAKAAICELDLLLDAGQYKVRLETAKRGKGQVTLSATAFTELNASPVRLVPRSGVVGTLKPGQQASFWVSMAKRDIPYIRIAGRNAGDVRLWRNGQWLEPTALQHSQVSPVSGQPQHEWWVDSTLEEGDYQLVVYGRDPTTVTGSSTDDSLTVEYGFRDAPVERALSFNLGPSGVLSLGLPRARYAAIASLTASPSSTVSLQAYSRGVRSAQSECRIEKGALIPECSTVASADSDQAQPLVLILRGPPGTRGQLEWADYAEGAAPSWGGYYGPSTTTLPFSVREPGKYLVSVQDLPNDGDGPPLGCQLEEVHTNGSAEQVRPIARSAVRINGGEKLQRDFNFPDEGASIWFEIGSGGSLMQRAGLSSRKFSIAVSGKGACDVYKVEGTGGLKRLTQTKPDGSDCSEALALDPGHYQLQLGPALSGVRTLTIADTSTSAPAAVTATGNCTLGLQQLNAGSHRVVLSRLGAVKVRGLTVASLPITGTLHLPLDAKQTLTIPVAPSSNLLVRSAAGAAFTCTSESGKAVSRGGECELPAGRDTLTVGNPGAAPLSLTLVQPGTLAPVSTPQSYSPVIAPIPALVPETPLAFDFERNQSRSVIFEVANPGLYNVTTQGLLATRCVLRTPAIEHFADDSGSGRGRNCLVQTWLQKGRYMFTASTVGQSTGRAALYLTRRNASPYPGVSGEGEQFFRAEANELVQQKLTVTSEGAYAMGTTAQGVKGLKCRLDDPDGWPLETVPSSCDGVRTLRPGTWLWTQLPLTVESMRHTSLSRVREAVVLKGNKPHPLEFFTWYDAELGADGKDEFTFKLEGETQLDVVLTNGMQGRVYRLEKDKAPKAVEVIPPQATEPSMDQDQQSPGDEQPEPMEQPQPSEEGGEEYSGQGDAEAPPAPQAAAVQTLRAQSAPPPPSGVKLTLPAGQYSITTEHSRGDVGIQYRLHLGSATLLPGMTRELPAPSVVPVSIPRDGTLRLRTFGDADVRCRLLDDKGKLVFEGSDNGADWNCALAESIAKGRYSLVLESETQQRGTTKVALALPAVDELGPFTEGAKATLAGSVVSWAIPVAEKDAVQELTVKTPGKTPISCALEDGSGAVVQRRSRVTECSLLVRPRLEKWRLRAWTTDGSAPVQLGLRSRPIVEGSGSAPDDKAVAVKVPRAGRYRTGTQVFCLGAQQTGVLRPCGPEVSLESGVTVFSTTGTKAQALAMDELVGTASDVPATIALSKQPFLQNVASSTPALFLLESTVQHGERAAPSCAFEGPGTVRERRDSACYAASRVGTLATARLWTASDAELEAKVVRTAATLPEKFDALKPGHQQLTFGGGVGRFALPKGARTRLELVIPKSAWAVLLDDGGASLDLCAPSADLRRCLLTGQGGSVAILSKQGVADVTAITLEGVPPSVAFTGLYESSPRVPGSLRLTLQANETDRNLTVEGALRCTVALSDGTRISSCRAKLPAGAGAELNLDYGVGPLRAMVHAPGREKWARLNAELPIVPGAALAPAVAVAVQGARLDRTLVVDKEAVVRISSEAGVCGLFRGSDLLSVDGLESGCELVRVLSAGTYRLVVRPFGSPSLPQGLLRWTADPVSQLTEGVGPEAWLAPGDVRLFRFDTANAGKVGLGVQAASEVLDCAVYNDAYQLVGEGCHQYLSLEKGRYLLTVRNPSAAQAVPRSFKPVLLGLTGETHEIPPDYLQDFFHRVEVRP